MDDLAAQARAALGLSKAAFAKLIGVQRSTIQGWEQGRAISGPAKALLQLAVAHPALVRATLSGETTPSRYDEPFVARDHAVPMSEGTKDKLDHIRAKAAGFDGDGGPPPRSRAADDLTDIPGYTNEFGYVGGQEEPGDLPHRSWNPEPELPELVDEVPHLTDLPEDLVPPPGPVV